MRPAATKVLRGAAFAAGTFVVLYGAADLASRAAHVAGPIPTGEIFSPTLVGDPQTLDYIATTTPVSPSRLVIPSIGVDATVETVGINAAGAMGTPKKFMDAGWYAPGPKPGEAGSAVIDGHVNNALTTAGVFAHLSSLQTGDLILVSDASNRTLAYRVQETALYGPTSAPLDRIFATSGPSTLVLITCEGDWVPSEKSFDKRLVVYAGLVGQ